MLIRENVIEGIEYSITKMDELKQIINCLSDTELKEILFEPFVEFGANILNNVEFQKMILTRFGQCDNVESELPMSNEDLSQYFLENWDLLVDTESIVIDPKLLFS